MPSTRFRTHFHQVILLDPQGKRAKRFAPIFCLYAAETFRREHTDGVWTWETVFRPLGKEAPTAGPVGDWVEKRPGLVAAAPCSAVQPATGNFW